MVETRLSAPAPASVAALRWVPPPLHVPAALRTALEQTHACTFHSNKCRRVSAQKAHFELGDGHLGLHVAVQRAGVGVQLRRGVVVVGGGVERLCKRAQEQMGDTCVCALSARRDGGR